MTATIRAGHAPDLWFQSFLFFRTCCFPNRISRTAQRQAINLLIQIKFNCHERHTTQLGTNKQEGTSVESLLWAGGIARPSPLSALSRLLNSVCPNIGALFLQAQGTCLLSEVLGTRKKVGKSSWGWSTSTKSCRRSIRKNFARFKRYSRRELFILTLLYFFISTWAPTLFISDTVIPIHSQLKTFNSTCATLATLTLTISFSNSNMDL